MSQVCQSINMSLKAWLIGSPKQKHNEDSDSEDDCSTTPEKKSNLVYHDKWLQEFDLLRYDTEIDVIFCQPCREANIGSRLNKTGGTPNAFAVGTKGFRHWALIKLHLTIAQSEGVYIFCFGINSKTKILLIWCFKIVCVCMCVCAIKFFDWGENTP